MFLLRLLCVVSVGIILSGCASSQLSRDAATNADLLAKKTKTIGEQVTHGSDAATAYQNSSQTTKGVLLGGSLGAATGSMTSSLGFFPGAAGGAVIGGLIGSYIDRHATLIDQLQNRGVRVIGVGDQLLLVLPSKRIFQDVTPIIRMQARSTLLLIAKVVNQYPNMSIKVAAFTNDSGLSPSVNLALSQQQADSIVRYLWQRVNTRLLSARGYGGSHLRERNNITWDQGENYRVEITLEKLPA